MDDIGEDIFSEVSEKESELLSYDELSEGWYSHKYFPVWMGANPYLYTEGKLYEVGEDGYLAQIVEEVSGAGEPIFFSGKRYTPITVKFWYGTKKPL